MFALNHRVAPNVYLLGSTQACRGSLTIPLLVRDVHVYIREANFHQEPQEGREGSKQKTCQDFLMAVSYC